MLVTNQINLTIDKCIRATTMQTYKIKKMGEFSDWYAGLNADVKKAIATRLARAEYGLLGDVEPVGEGVSELKIHIGAGWRVYFTMRNKHLIVLLGGGAKKTQKHDIKKARELAANLE